MFLVSVAILLIKFVRNVCKRFKVKPKDKVEQFSQGKQEENAIFWLKNIEI